MYTEDEAKTKWCPYVYIAYKKDVGKFDKDNCIASECMMWKWDEKPPQSKEINVDYTGYCGLTK